jgi:hypothetical protein
VGKGGVARIQDNPVTRGVIESGQKKTGDCEPKNDRLKARPLELIHRGATKARIFRRRWQPFTFMNNNVVLWALGLTNRQGPPETPAEEALALFDLVGLPNAG